MNVFNKVLESLIHWLIVVPLPRQSLRLLQYGCGLNHCCTTVAVGWYCQNMSKSPLNTVHIGLGLYIGPKNDINVQTSQVNVNVE